MLTGLIVLGAYAVFLSTRPKQGWRPDLDEMIIARRPENPWFRP